MLSPYCLSARNISRRTCDLAPTLDQPELQAGRAPATSNEDISHLRMYERNIAALSVHIKSEGESQSLQVKNIWDMAHRQRPSRAAGEWAGSHANADSIDAMHNDAFSCRFVFYRDYRNLGWVTLLLPLLLRFMTQLQGVMFLGVK